MCFSFSKAKAQAGTDRAFAADCYRQDIHWIDKAFYVIAIRTRGNTTRKAAEMHDKFSELRLPWRYSTPGTWPFSDRGRLDKAVALKLQ